MGSLFNFNSLITPRVMRLLFGVGVLISGLVSLGIIGAGLAMARTFGSALLSLLVIVLALVGFCIGVIASRVSCECILVMFMIRSELAHIRQTMATARPQPAQGG
jgi:hypothetical protein